MRQRSVTVSVGVLVHRLLCLRIMTTTYRITSTVSGTCLGIYEADSPEAALDAMARDAGYRDHAEACDVTGDDGDHLLVTEHDAKTDAGV